MAEAEKNEAGFRVMQFTLHVDDAGHPAQNHRDLGRYQGIVEAFNTARLAALKAYTSLLKTPEGRTGTLTFIDTEWGYDIRRQGLVIERFWVHDREAAVPV